MEQQMVLGIVDMASGETRQSTLFELTDELIETMSRGSESQRRFDAAHAAAQTFGARLGVLESAGTVSPHDVAPRIRDYVAGMAVFAGFDDDDKARLRNAGLASADSAKARADAEREANAC